MELVKKTLLYEKTGSSIDLSIPDDYKIGYYRSWREAAPEHRDHWGRDLWDPCNEYIADVYYPEEGRGEWIANAPITASTLGYFPVPTSDNMSREMFDKVVFPNSLTSLGYGPTHTMEQDGGLSTKEIVLGPNVESIHPRICCHGLLEKITFISNSYFENVNGVIYKNDEYHDLVRGTLTSDLRDFGSIWDVKAGSFHFWEIKDRTIHLPVVESMIEEYAFESDRSIQNLNLYIHSTVPPSLRSKSFYLKEGDSMTVWVPQGCSSAYYSYWSESRVGEITHSGFTIREFS